jgi:hypothetical protein
MPKRNYETNLRERARELRRQGLTYTEISETLGVEIPKSTLNHWVSDVLLTDEQLKRIKEKEQEGAARGREGGLWGGAAGFNKEMKRRRIEAAREQAQPIIERLADNKDALMLMASALYMGEGAKGEKHFSFANSNPKYIAAWVSLLRSNFEIDESKFRCRILISDNQNAETLEIFWSGVTGVPRSQFQKAGVREASGQKKEGYMGVCVVDYYSSEIRRLLDAIGEGVIDELLNEE